ncbi:hypothetical protein [Klebsiella pneumoniae]|nr:hypothetical protein [Klebsiella pneumoniae]
MNNKEQSSDMNERFKEQAITAAIDHAISVYKAGLDIREAVEAIAHKAFDLGYEYAYQESIEA